MKKSKKYLLLLPLLLLISVGIVLIYHSAQREPFSFGELSDFLSYKYRRTTYLDRDVAGEGGTYDCWLDDADSPSMAFVFVDDGDGDDTGIILSYNDGGYLYQSGSSTVHEVQDSFCYMGKGAYTIPESFTPEFMDFDGKNAMLDAAVNIVTDFCEEVYSSEATIYHFDFSAYDNYECFILIAEPDGSACDFLICFTDTERFSEYFIPFIDVHEPGEWEEGYAFEMERSFYTWDWTPE